MADDDSNALRNEEAEKLRAYKQDRDMLRRGVKIGDTIRVSPTMIEGVTDYGDDVLRYSVGATLNALQRNSP